MPTYRVPFTTTAHFYVEIEADNEDDAADNAWQYAQDYAQTILGDGLNVTAEIDLDGVGADDGIIELPAVTRPLKNRA